MKRRNLKDNLRDYFNRWKNNTIRLNDKDKRNKIFTTLVKNLINSKDRRILYKRFNQWRQRPKVDTHGEMSKIKNFEIILSKIYKNHLQPEKEELFDKFIKTRADRELKRSEGKISKNYGKKTRIYYNIIFINGRNR